MESLIENNEMQTAQMPRLVFSSSICSNNCTTILERTKQTFPTKNTHVYYAMKANSNPQVQRNIFKAGIGAEIITESEFQTAKDMDAHIVVNGHYKSDRLIRMAVAGNVDMINVESLEELLRIDRVAAEIGTEYVPIGIRAQLLDNQKIGFNKQALNNLSDLNLTRCKIRGLHFHAGWNVKDDKQIVSGILRMNQVKHHLEWLGHTIDTYNFGGSLCEASFDGDQLSRRMEIYKEHTPAGISTLHFEPGRYLVGDAGFLEATVVGERNGYFCLNTCAYGYKLTGASQKINILPQRPRKMDFPQKIRFSGYWPAESDQITVCDLTHTPKVGDKIYFQNMGAYVDDFKKQFEYNHGLEFAVMD